MTMLFIKNVRVSFPRLFSAKTTADGRVLGMGAHFILDLDENAKAIADIKKAIAELLKENIKDKKLPADKICLRDGNLSAREEYENKLYLSTSTREAPLVLKRGSLEKLTDEASSEIYGGCYVNAKISLWFQNNKFGQRVNAELKAIQFANDGESFGAGRESESSLAQGFDDNAPTANEELEKEPWDL